MSNAAKTMDGQDWGLLIFLSLLWGGSFFFAGVALKELPPLTVVLVRVALAAAALLPIFWYLGHRLPRTWSGWRPFVGMGLLANVVPFALISTGQTQIAVGLASIVNATTPVFVVVVMAAFREERLTTYRIVGVLLGVGGVAILSGLQSQGDGSQLLGIALCAAGALSYAFAALWGRRQLSDVHPLKSATCQLICSAVIMAVIVVIFDRPWTLDAPSATTLYAVAGLAILGTAVAYIVFFQILVRAGASNAMLVTLLVPVTAVALGSVFLGEQIHLTEILGAIVIGIGLVFIDGRIVDRFLGRRPPKEKGPA